MPVNRFKNYMNKTIHTYIQKRKEAGSQSTHNLSCIDCESASLLFFIYIYLKHNGDVLAKSNKTKFCKYNGKSYIATCMSYQVWSTSIETECMN